MEAGDDVVEADDTDPLGRTGVLVGNPGGEGLGVDEGLLELEEGLVLVGGEGGGEGGEEGEEEEEGEERETAANSGHCRAGKLLRLGRNGPLLVGENEVVP